MHTARKVKNDEFYTQIRDIEKELNHYAEHFKGKTVFLNCDDPEDSHFWKLFALDFERLKLNRLVSFHYHDSEPTYKLELIKDTNQDGKVDGLDTIKTNLTQNGDFRSPESIAELRQSDIIVTNPPFSLFREFVDLLIKEGKQFLIVGNMNAITYKEIFKLIKDDKIWLGCTRPSEFRTPEGMIKKFGNICWFTNLAHTKRATPLRLYQKYSATLYPKYDNYDAIEVSKVQDIPKDYAGTMGVPISFLEKYNPQQFEICGTQRWFYDESLGITGGKTLLNGKETYDRIFIKHRNVKV